MRFGNIEVDPERRELSVDGAARHLEPRAFDLLLHLVNHRDRVVSKEELLDEVWGDQFVSESALTTRVKEIRQATGDDGIRQETVRNFRGRGYRWVASETESPAAPLDLVGRIDDAAELERLLAGSSLVTILGPGGAGKTTIARRLAVEYRDAQDGLTFVELAHVSRPEAVLPAIALEAGIHAAAHDERTSLDTLAGLNGLLVLDNCEHLIERVAVVVQELLNRGGPIRILATSRERLGVSGEQVFSLTPLSAPAARELLERRLAEGAPGARLEGEPQTVDRLLELVDRLPLGIEMVAPYLPILGVEGLLAHVGSRLDLLQSPNRGADPRHRDLQSLVAWSLDLLEPASLQTLIDMSVFSGPAAVEQLAAVLDRSEAELAVGPLTDLASKSLVVVDDSGPLPTFGLLETVRAAVSARRDPSVDERHARSTAATAREVGARLLTPQEPEAAVEFDRLTREIRSARGWASVNDPRLERRLILSAAVYAHERQWPEPAVWATELVADTPIGELDPHLSSVLASDASNRGDFDRARALAERALTATTPAVRASALDTIANVGLYTGELELARRAGAEARDLGSEHGDAYMWTLGTIDLALGHVFDSQLAEAEDVLRRSVPPRALGPTSSAWMAYTEAELAAAEGRDHDAIKGFDRAIRIARPVGSRYVVTVSEVARVALIARSGDTDRALATFEATIEQYRRLHSTTHVVTALRHVVVLLVRVKRTEPAIRILGALRSSGREPYGAESELLDDALVKATADVGADSVAVWLDDGAGKSVEWAAELAASALKPGSSRAR